MKNKGANMRYADERAHDLMRVYREYISACSYICMPQLYRTIVNMPSRRFWVSDVRAALVISAMMRGEEDLSRMWPSKREMYREIYRRVCKLKERFPALSLSQLCARVVRQPAPKFYLTPGSAKMLVCKAKKSHTPVKRKGNCSGADTGKRKK